MARTPTTLHGINKAGSSSDLYVMADDYTNLIDRLENAVAGLAAFAAGSNYVNANANNAGKILSAVGGSYRGRIIGVSAAGDAALIVQDNAGTTGTDKFAFGYDDSADVFQFSAGATLGNGPRINTSGHLTTLSTDLGVRGGVLQVFQLAIRNNGGTIEHAITLQALSFGASNLVGRITGASSSYATLNQDWTAWTNGLSAGSSGGGNNHILVLNTAAQTGGGAGGVAVGR